MPYAVMLFRIKPSKSIALRCAFTYPLGDGQC